MGKYIDYETGPRAGFYKKIIRLKFNPNYFRLEYTYFRQKC